MTLNASLVECRSLEEVNLIGKVHPGRHLSNVESRQATPLQSVVFKTHVTPGEGIEVSKTGHVTKRLKKPRKNVQRLLFERSVSSPAIVVRSQTKDGVIASARVQDRQIKEERAKMRTEWNMKDRHVSFDECVHVLTKCEVIEMPLKNSSCLTNNSQPNGEGCHVCRMESTQNSRRLLGRKVTFGFEEMLQAAVLDHNLSEVECICKQRGTNLNKKLSNGLTLLHLASIEGCFRTVQYILQQGGHVDEKDDHGWTALHYASLHSNVPCALALLGAGADICSRTGDDYREVIELASEDEMILLLGRMMNSSLSKHKDNQNKETYV